MAEAVQIGHVVEDYYLGSTHVLICDDFCRNQTEEERNEILRKVGDIIMTYWQDE